MNLFRTACLLVLLQPLVVRADVDPVRFERLTALLNDAITDRDPPGAVVLVLHQGEVVYRQALGLQRVRPEETPLTPEAVFDLASLTKPIATATSVMLLIERGQLRLSDRASEHWPEFTGHGKEAITVEQLLFHTSGLIADNALRDYEEGREQALERICGLELSAEPGERFTYSDVGFIVLGHLVERVSRQPLDEFTRENIFAPLGMSATGYRPGDSLLPRVAPTTKEGEVHDPRAALMDGVAGHAGLFAPIDDLAIFAQMLLNQGSHNGQQILSPFTVRLMTQPRPVPGGWRTLGWDVATGYSSNRGSLFPAGTGFGHTGFTGTSMWIDPASDTAVIFLSSRLHPDGRGDVGRLRGQVATLVAAALSPSRPEERPQVLTGIDVLVEERFARLKGKRVGLVTNHSGRDRTGRSTIDLLHEAEGVELVALFSPEHGIRGEKDEAIGDSVDAKTGVPIFSLYGDRRQPTPDTLQGIDTLVYDIQDAGCRFYTYISTLGLIMEAAAEQGVAVVILDRPNPINGQDIAGPLLDEGAESFVGYHSLPIRHGLTVGEVARLYQRERKIECQLDVVSMLGWRRSDFFDATGLEWVNPSPNLRNLSAAVLYPGIGLLETTNLSVGRGTDEPFEWFGAPWLDAVGLASALNEIGLPGVRFYAKSRTPASSVFAGELCRGVQIEVVDRAQFEPVRTGIAIACELRRLHQKEWQAERYARLLGDQQTLDGLLAGQSFTQLEQAWRDDLAAFHQRREAVLLYPE